MIGIVILNYNNYKVTIDCIASIFNNPPQEDFHIFIIDNGSKNESVKVLKSEYLNNSIVSIHETGSNLGFAQGNNIGITLCKNNNINECILSNSDILFLKGSIDSLVYDIRNCDNAVIVGPKVMAGKNSDKIMPSSMLNKIRLIDILEIGRLFPQKRLDEINELGIHKVYTVSGCCFCINIDKFKAMGGFDNNTFLYNEENILGVQAEKASLNTYIDLDSKIIHDHGSSSGRNNDFVCKEYIKSTLYYWKSYRNTKKHTLKLILFSYYFKLILKNQKEIHPLEIYQCGKQYLSSL